jgi:hypothetical protein
MVVPELGNKYVTLLRRFKALLVQNIITFARDYDGSAHETRGLLENATTHHHRVQPFIMVYGISGAVVHSCVFRFVAYSYTCTFIDEVRHDREREKGGNNVQDSASDRDRPHAQAGVHDGKVD